MKPFVRLLSFLSFLFVPVHTVHDRPQRLRSSINVRDCSHRPWRPITVTIQTVQSVLGFVVSNVDFSLLKKLIFLLLNFLGFILKKYSNTDYNEKMFLTEGGGDGQ